MKIRYDNSLVRRQDRLLSKESAINLLERAEYGILSMVTDDSKPYAVPLNFVFDGSRSIYVHCAPEGKKLRMIDANNHVQFCVVGKVNLLSSKFTTEYESIILIGTAHRNLSVEERHHALELLLRKLSPADVELGMKYAEKSFHRTEVIRIDIDEMSGKAKSLKH